LSQKKSHFSMNFLNISAPAESRVAVFRWLTWHEFGERSREHKGLAIAKKKVETDIERMSEGGKINVSIKSSQGEKLVVEVDPSGTVLEFKQAVQEKTNIPPEQQRLIFGGHVLKDARTVESYGKPPRLPS